MDQLTLTELQQVLLERLGRSRKSPQWLATRATIVLELAAGASPTEAARRLRLGRNTVYRWRRRWRREGPELTRAEERGEDEPVLSERIRRLLSDRYRSGAPPKFGRREVGAIVRLARTRPRELGLDFDRWNARRLAEEVVRRGVVPSISPRSVSRILTREGVQL